MRVALRELSTPFTRPLLYHPRYLLFVIVSALDVVMTWHVLARGGWEVNALANAVLHEADMPGLVAYKFTIVASFVMLCEVIGRRRPVVGRRLLAWAIGVTCVPVVWAVVQLALVG